MSIRGISFGSIFSGRKLRFDSQNSNFVFTGANDIQKDAAMIKYGHPDIKLENPVPAPPMPKYAPPPEPQNYTGFVILSDNEKKDDKTEMQKL